MLELLRGLQVGEVKHIKSIVKHLKPKSWIDASRAARAPRRCRAVRVDGDDASGVGQRF